MNVDLKYVKLHTEKTRIYLYIYTQKLVKLHQNIFSHFFSIVCTIKKYFSASKSKLTTVHFKNINLFLLDILILVNINKPNIYKIQF